MAYKGRQSPPDSWDGDIRGSSYATDDLSGKEVKVTQNKISMKQTSENTRGEKEEDGRPQDVRSFPNQVDKSLKNERTRFNSLHFKPIDLPGSSAFSKCKSTSYSESNYRREPSISSDLQHRLRNNQVERFEIPSSSNEGNSAASDNAEDFDGDDEDETGQDNSSNCSSSTGSRNVTGKEREKKTKTRIIYYPSQIEILERAFEKDPYPDKSAMANLAQELEIPDSKIKNWFQNKRARWKRRRNGDALDRARLAASMSPFIPPMFHYPFMPGTMSPLNWSSHYMGKTNERSPPHSAAGTTDKDGKSNVHTQLTPFQSTPTHLQMPPFFFPYGMFPQYYFGKK